MHFLHALTASRGYWGQFGFASSSDDFQEKCLQFHPQTIVQNAQLTKLEFLANGTDAEFPNNDPSCGGKKQTVEADLCRVGLTIKTSNRSEIAFELWLPEKWTGRRLLSTGNGGIDGCIKYPDLAYGSAHGFATLGTNNGHEGASARAMLNNEDVIVDFSHRALHTGTGAGRLLAEAFYGAAPARSYYLGCSLGGRMGVQAADLHPDDYDGIVAGAPAVDFNLLQGQRAMFYNVTGAPGSSDYVPVETWRRLIHDEVLRQCDALDGVADGIIEVPSRCRFDPGTLLCDDHHGGSGAAACLNEAQVRQLRRIYADYRWPNGTLLFPRMNPGNELAATEKLLAGRPFNYSVEYYRYAVTGDRSWDMSRFTFAAIEAGDRADPGRLRTWPASLRRFQARGGKVLAYHGGQDNQITSFQSERFYERLAQHHGHAAMDGWFRFFRVAGMQHCSGGPGAWVLGQGGGAAATPPGGFDAETSAGGGGGVGGGRAGAGDDDGDKVRG
ncbi:Tannase/feruloyl esterase [Cordyceps fumosorosea ARSEF 2679]|uniref:Carboxylic ester hydrolase n=1 Tax=Cordyceps fumosorosea (strain ARSEF 2679) TaxID=1081104 RepID=A0A168E3W8_CORFA|nr:Tannase/feruloyl esterase [Cordyceps fumosorosea ARSEF 2679]OAA73345.1 Tannase/feruloyl esterase [Cordyceps fumosorosea ARSEF 2679]